MGGVSRRRRSNHTGARIDEEIGGGHELSAQSSAQRPVQPRHHGRWPIGPFVLRCQRHFNHRRKQGGGHAVAGHICHEHTQAMFVDFEKVVIVSGHCGHRPVPCRGRHAGDARRRLRQYRRLDLLRNAQLPFDRDKAPRITGDTPGHQSCEAPEQYREAERLNVGASKRHKLHTAQVVGGRGQRPCDHTNSRHAQLAGRDAAATEKHADQCR